MWNYTVLELATSKYTAFEPVTDKDGKVVDLVEMAPPRRRRGWRLFLKFSWDSLWWRAP